MKETHVRKWALLSIAALCSFFGFGFQAVPVLAWIYLMAVIQIFRHEDPPAWFCALYILVTSITGISATYGFYCNIRWTDAIPIVAVFTGLYSVFYLAGMKVESCFRRNYESDLHLMVSPIIITSLTFLWTRFGPVGGAGHLAYTQAGETSLVQLASIWGIHGIMFLLCTVSSLAVSVLNQQETENLSVDTKNEFRKFFARKGVWLSAIVLLCLIYGGVRTNLTNDTFFQRDVDNINLHQPYEIMCLADSEVLKPASSPFFWTPDSLIDAIENVIANNPNVKLIVSAEARFFLWDETEVAKAAKRLEVVSTRSKVYMILSICAAYNSLIAFVPGKPHVKYNKHNMIPFMESSNNKSNGKLGYIDTLEFGRIGFVICFDSDFPSYLIQASSLGVDLLFQSANTWGPLRFVHAGYAKFRAVEQGVTLLRCCSNGVSGLYDPFYRTLQEEETFPGSKKSVMKVAWSRKKKVWTLYGALGDSMSWICCAFAGLILLSLCLPKEAVSKFTGIFSQIMPQNIKY